jgi:DNA-binding CsgD family transcriptional regulator
MAFSSAGLDLQTYDALLSAAGTAALPERLFDAIDRIVPVREIYGFELAPGAAPAPIVSLGRGAGAAARVDAYSRRYYPGDPLGAAIRRSRPSLALQIHRIDPAEIGDAEYRNECYEVPRFGDKISIVMERGQSRFVLSLFRPRPRAELTAELFRRLRGLAEVALPILAKHRSLLRDHDLHMLPLLERIAARLSYAEPGLSARESAVCARTLAGMTAEGIALDLGIGAASVLTYRRRAYRRLGISGINQLLPLLGV